MYGIGETNVGLTAPLVSWIIRESPIRDAERGAHCS